MYSAANEESGEISYSPPSPRHSSEDAETRHVPRRCRWPPAASSLLSAAPAVAAPDLTLTATHARATFLRSTPPNTTPHSGTLTLTVRNAGADATAAR